MITIRQNCIRCETNISHEYVNKESGVYNCTECNTVGSIYDDKEYKAPNNISSPESVNTQILADKMYIDIKGHSSVPMRGPFSYLILGILFLIAIGGMSRCFHFDARSEPAVSVPILIALCVIFVILMFVGQYRMKKRIIRIELGPKIIKINQINNGITSEVNEFEENSFMISQIFVREEERTERNDDGNITKKYNVYLLKALLKDMTEKTILPEIITKETYLYIETIMEDYLGIKNRKISSETD